ncbi:raiA ribosome-associated inhibitor A [Sulfurifustis variabilis]|uniref:RaiA ribosome-associated inhibitor A n=1 Tax=Sulfurifustis variabilis TaxID=1675686 RepID=A0A1B4V4F0_9GAMM|nr:ribosome-associated translation inhibitor RaiA [Sulfurifustis variabilis]BAU48418.1 raiA ribosome-associated inhibitor A [Sulfurifustis variabilis]
MKLPLQIVFRNLDPSDAIEAKVRERAERLERYADDVMSCRVVVEAEHKHRHQGHLYHVRVDLKVPGAELVASREPELNHAHEDVYVAIRDAFDAVRRRLEDHERRRRGDVKSHETPPHGRIVELNPGEDYGRIETGDGRTVYFHRHSVIDADFGDLAVGAEVRFVEEMGERGPQASTVRLVGKHHPG